MIINGKKYRIIEKIYGDGHKEYMAQYAINFLFFNIWKNFIVETIDYGYGCINFLCCGKTYEDCLEHLKESIKKQEEERKKKQIININKIE